MAVKTGRTGLRFGISSKPALKLPKWERGTCGEINNDDCLVSGRFFSSQAWQIIYIYIDF